MGFLDKLFGSSSASPSKMSDAQLQKKLDNSVGKNTGESVASRAAYIREGQKRGITPKQK